jgi:hypothetical protein
VPVRWQPEQDPDAAPSERPRRSPSFSGSWSRLLAASQAAAFTPGCPRPQPRFELARPRRMKKSARAVLLWSLASYAVAAVVLDVIMDRWCPAPFEQVYRTKWGELCQLTSQEPDRPLVIMLGSSRTDGGFEARRLDGLPAPDGRPLLAYNFGVPAAGPIHEYLYLRQLLERGIRPRLLLVEFLPPLFNDGRSRLISEENWTIPAWMSPLQLVRIAPYLAHPIRKEREWVEARLAPWYVHRPSLTGWVQEKLYPPSPPHTIPWYHDRWGMRYPETLSPAEYAFRSGVARDYIPTLGRFRMGKEPARAMRDLLECCRREQIPVMLVLTPESAEFRSWYSPECRATTMGLLKNLRTAYGVEVIDATHWLNDDDFVDGHHLDVTGVEKYTTRLLAEVQRVLR